MAQPPSTETPRQPEYEPFPVKERASTWLNQIDTRIRQRIPAPAYRSMLAGYHSLRKLAGRNPGRGRLLPDFVIIGAAKSGTTSLYAWVCEHPLIERPQRKEIHYFSYYHYRGTDWYRQFFPAERDRRAFAATHGRPFITGEASATYMSHPLVPQRMAEVMPNAKLIVVLRNPIDRAHSQYQMRRRDNYEPEELFRALELEDPGFARNPPRSGEPGDANRSNLSRGRYAEQLERWFALYPREQVHVLSTDDLASDPRQAMRAVHEFLGLPPHDNQDVERRFTASYEEMPAEIRARLVDYYREHNQRLYELLGRDFGWER
jgi:hypothetical protein